MTELTPEEDIPGDPPADSDLSEVQPHPNFVPIPIPEIAETATDEDSDQ